MGKSISREVEFFEDENEYIGEPEEEEEGLA
jgi:hypothetical protein